MDLKLYQQPRTFFISDGEVTIKDWGKVHLDADEMISFKGPSGGECDFGAKSWGFYPTSSVNARMVREGFKVALVRNHDHKLQINVVSKDHLQQYEEYLQSHKHPPQVLCWLDELTQVQCDEIENICSRKEGMR